MRYFGLIFIVALAIAALIWANVHLANKKRPSPAADNALANEIARQLDRVVTDPTLIGSSDWRQQSNGLLDKWYKGN